MRLRKGPPTIRSERSVQQVTVAWLRYCAVFIAIIGLAVAARGWMVGQPADMQKGSAMLGVSFWILFSSRNMDKPL